MASFKIIGLPDDSAAEYLESELDLCFGKHYATSAHECINCRAPAIMDGKLVLMKEICAMKVAGGTSVARLKRLSSTEVLTRLEQGMSLPQIFREILATAPPDQAAAAARQLLVDRLTYLKTTGFEPDPVPRTKVLLEESK